MINTEKTGNTLMNLKKRVTTRINSNIHDNSSKVAVRTFLVLAEIFQKVIFLISSIPCMAEEEVPDPNLNIVDRILMPNYNWT
ncbi:hypothetical protein D3C87_1792190 [compost metagenome]